MLLKAPSSARVHWSIIIAGVAFFGCIGGIHASDPPNVRSDSDLPALHLSYADAQRILRKAASVAAKVNGADAKSHETLSVSGNDRDAVVAVDQLTTDGRLPPLATTVVYSYSSDDPAPITSFRLDFRDYGRTVTVAGHDPAQVDALYASLRSDLLQYSVPLGGLSAYLGFHTMVPLVFGLLAVVLMLYWWLERRSRALLIAAGWCLVVVVAMRALPLHQMLAGVLLTSGDPSIWVRYGPQISAAGVVLAIAVPIVQAAHAYLRKVPDSREPTDDRERRYLDAHARVMEALARRPNITIIRNEFGNAFSVANELFDGIVTGGTSRIALSTLRSSTRSNLLRLFIARAASEVHANRVQTVVVIFFKGERDEELRQIALEQLPLYVRPIRAAFQILVLDPDNIDSGLAAVRWGK